MVNAQSEMIAEPEEVRAGEVVTIEDIRDEFQRTRTRLSRLGEKV
mgnify:CR=1 FL=1